MSNYTSDLLRLLNERGYIHQITDAEGLDALAAKQIVPGYIGFDATAPSLHIGSLVQIMMLRRLQQAGHKPIVVMGGGTTKVGDPSGKVLAPPAVLRTACLIEQTSERSWRVAAGDAVAHFLTRGCVVA